MGINRIKVSCILLCVLVLIIIALYFAEKNADRTRIHNGNRIIEKIELYKNTNGYPPNWLQSIGYEEYDLFGLHDGNPIHITDMSTSGTSIIKVNGYIFCYKRVDSINYMLWFGTTLGEGIYYYSDTKQWEDLYRQMPMQIMP
jgi:hypothetical protein